ncbi:PucR family transcriptional regulator [Mediterraneibacter sp. ICN-202921]|uniref:PucR family transcriptional regulator n=1 Tax=Mediterraneibacter sp. ICN-202921 TaxID=3134657 RepID=UPI0030BB499B
MKLTVNDIRQLWEKGQAELVAGKEGLAHTVEVYDMMEQPDIKPWLRKDMLLITTGYAIRNDKEKLLDLIRDLHEADAAALAIKTRFFGEFPKEALKLADELHFPLFFLNNALGFMETVYPVMTAIVKANNGIEMQDYCQIGQSEKRELDRTFYFALVQGKMKEEKEAQVRAHSLCWPKVPVRWMEIRPLYTKKGWGGQNKERMEEKAELFFQKQQLPYIKLSFPEKTMILFCEPKYILPFKKALKERLEKLEEAAHTELCMLISDSIGRYLDMPKAAGQLSALSRIAGNVSVEEKVLWREEMQYEELLLEIAKLPQVKLYVEERLYCLKEYDREHGTKLIETLEMMMRNGGSKKQTAEKLYLHRNTMLYRVKKIEEILKCDMGDFKTLQELEFLCRVKAYFSESEEG